MTETDQAGCKPIFSKPTIKIILYYLGLKFFTYFYTLFNLNFDENIRILTILAYIICTSIVIKREFDYFQWLLREEKA